MENVCDLCDLAPEIRENLLKERIQPSHVGSLTDIQLTNMGLTTIGARFSFRQACASVSSDRRPLTLSRSNTNKRQKVTSFPKSNLASWTHRFVCLSKCDAETQMLQVSEREALLKAGLGEKKVVMKDVERLTVNDMEEYIYSTYPKLRDRGGFEMCVAAMGGRHKLEVVDHRNLSVKELRTVVGQSRIYIRPTNDIEIEVIDRRCSRPQHRTPKSSNSSHVRLSQRSSTATASAAGFSHRSSTCDMGHPLNDEFNLCEVCAEHADDIAGRRNQIETDDRRIARNNVDVSHHSLFCNDGHPLEFEHSLCVVCEQRCEDSLCRSELVQMGCTSPFLEYVNLGTPTVQLRQPTRTEQVQNRENTETLHREIEPKRQQSACTESSKEKLSYYDTYVSVTCSEDTEIHDDIISSDNIPELLNVSNTQTTRKTLSDVIHPLLRIIGGEPVTLIINRSAILRSFEMGVKRKPDWFTRPVCVIFSGEQALDEGGPRREFLRLLMSDVVERMSILTGESCHKTFTYALGLLTQRKYFLAGQMVTWSVLNGGPGIPVIMESLFDMMVERNAIRLNEDVDKVDNDELGLILKKLHEITNEGEFQQALVEEQDFFLGLGLQTRQMSRSTLIKTLMTEKIFNRFLPAITQFKEGLGELLTVACEEAETVKQLFVHNQNLQFSYVDFRKIYHIEWSDEGTNRKTLEQETVFAWECVLQQIGDRDAGISFEDLLTFWTGAASVPPIGFDKMPTLDFFTRIQGERRFPTASTCGLVLFLPRGVVDSDELLELLVFGVQNTAGFGKI